MQNFILFFLLGLTVSVSSLGFVHATTTSDLDNIPEDIVYSITMPYLSSADIIRYERTHKINSEQKQRIRRNHPEATPFFTKNKEVHWLLTKEDLLPATAALLSFQKGSLAKLPVKSISYLINKMEKLPSNAIEDLLESSTQSLLVRKYLDFETEALLSKKYKELTALFIAFYYVETAAWEDIQKIGLDTSWNNYKDPSEKSSGILSGLAWQTTWNAFKSSDSQHFRDGIWEASQNQHWLAAWEATSQAVWTVTCERLDLELKQKLSLILEKLKLNNPFQVGEYSYRLAELLGAKFLATSGVELIDVGYQAAAKEISSDVSFHPLEEKLRESFWGNPLTIHSAHKTQIEQLFRRDSH